MCATVGAGAGSCMGEATAVGATSRRGPLYHILRHVSRGELAQPRVVVFMAGLPGAGKSTVVNQRYQPHRASTVVVDLDQELALHRRFDPSDPDRLYLEKSRHAYDWADRQVEARFQAALADSSVRRIVVEGTGTNCERQARRMRQAREAGWFVKVLYVHIPLQTAIRRAASRPRRPVSAARVCEYHAKILASLVAIEPLADEVETYDAPSYGDPAHVLRQEGYVEKTRQIVAAAEAAEERFRLEHARAMHAAGAGAE